MSKRTDLKRKKIYKMELYFNTSKVFGTWVKNDPFVETKKKRS